VCAFQVIPMFEDVKDEVCRKYKDEINKAMVASYG
jgi:hypothetical protein